MSIYEQMAADLRAGSLMVGGRKAYNNYFQYDAPGHVCSACGLGAMALAIGEDFLITSAFARHYGVDITLIIVIHPIDAHHTTLYDCIADLSDTYDWSHEQIADWLENRVRVWRLQ